MSRPTAARRWLRIAAVLLGLASSAGFLWLAAARLELHDLSAALARAELWPWMPLGVLSYLTGHALRGWRCQRLVSAESSLSAGVATQVVVLGYAVNNVAPARLGEVVRAGMLAERSGLPFVQALTVTFVERVLDGLTLLGLLVVAAASAPREPWLIATLELGVAVFGVATLGIAAAVLAPELSLRLASRVGAPFGPRLHARVLGLASQVTRGTAQLAEPRIAFEVIALSLLVWLCEAGLFLALLPALGLEARPGVALLAMTVTNLGILVPSSPGFVGPFHFFCMKALGAVGVPAATALGYAVLVHLGFYVPITLLGLGVVLSWGVSLGDALTRARAARAAPEAPRELSGVEPREPAATPSTFTRRLCEALVPPPPPTLDGAAHERAVELAARFLEAQVAALPVRLRVLYACGMLGFRALAALRFPGGFTRAPLEARRRYAEAWAYGGFSLGRQLLRAPRVTSLLGYYEHAGEGSA